jgi:SAM-dependent methyltransferase
VAYGSDLAWVHHHHFGDLARNAGPAVVRALEKAGLDRGLVVDLGCGSGILARALTGAGYDVVGVDLSEDMLRLAAAHAPDATLVRSSVLDYELPACVAVTAVGECLNYAFDERIALAELSRLFAGIHRALEPGGVLVFDVAGPGRLGPGQDRQTVYDGGSWTLFLRAVEDVGGTTLQRDITVFRRVGRLYRRADERHVLRLYRREEVAGELIKAGFEVRRIPGYNDFRFPVGLAGFIATKSG